MIKVDSHIALQHLNTLKEQLSERKVATAMSHAINRTLTHERKVSRQIVRKKYNMPSDTVDNFRQRNANSKQLTGILDASSKAIPISRFNPKFKGTGFSAKIKRVSEGKGKDKKFRTDKLIGSRKGKSVGGVSFTIEKGNPQTLAFAFITSGNLNSVFARGTYAGKGFTTSKSRLPIAKMKTLSLYQAIAGEASKEALNKDGLEFYAKTMESQLKYQISKATKNV
jgi:hypothetical protein